jgi:formamidopyrimidine-DNA glycosylase
LTASTSLDLAKRKKLYSAVVTVLSEAVSAGGANIDGVFKAGGFVTNTYGRKNKPCRICGASVVKIKVSQRGTHFCPQCQLNETSNVLNG